MCFHQRVPAYRPTVQRAQSPKNLELKQVSARVRKPAGVQLLLRATVGGEPYAHLSAADLVVTEDGVAVPRDRWSLVPSAVGAEGSLLLLIDLSGVLGASGVQPILQRWLKAVLVQLPPGLQVALAGFDGRAGVQMLQDFTEDHDALRQAVAGLSTYKVVDRSRNLYGAVDKALDLLRARKPALPGRHVMRALVLVTTGPDEASRRSHDDVYRKLESEDRRGTLLFAIGVGPKAGPVVVEEMGQTEHYVLRSVRQLDPASALRYATRLRRHWESHRVLSVCSARRDGSHTLAVAPARNRTGGITYPFSAQGFQSGCSADWFKRSCKVVQCGGPPGSACASCPDGKVCRDHLCIPAAVAYAAQRRQAEAARQARAERARLAESYRRQYRGCLGRRVDAERQWKTYREAEALYLRSDCGFRIMAELGVRAYPGPPGVGGAVLVGWSLPKRWEFHLGLGFSLEHAAVLAQSRIRVFSWRSLDLLVVPRLGVGFGRHGAMLYEATAMVGARLRLGRHFAIYSLFGPGVTHGTLEAPPAKRTAFYLPFWFGTELRL